MSRHSGHQRIMGSLQALVMMVLYAEFQGWIDLDTLIGNAGVVRIEDTGGDLSWWS